MGYQDQNSNEIFTWIVKAGANRVYYLNIKQDKNGEIYLVVKESKKNYDESREIHRVMIFKKDLAKFFKGMEEVQKFIEKEGIDLSEPEYEDYNSSSDNSTDSDDSPSVILN